jgi:hypothetical protein
MMGCNDIKKLIDEADRPEVLPFDAARHVTECAGCESFASERASLRRLVASGARISVPVNFDAMLRERLERRMARGAFSWLSPAGYMRMGAAAAGLAVAVFAAQSLGVFSGEPHSPTPATAPAGVAATRPAPAPRAASDAPGVVGFAATRPAAQARQYAVRAGRAHARQQRASLAGSAGAERDLPNVKFIVIDTDGERELTVSPVSVGAQSAILTNSGRATPRNVAVSF